MNVSLKTFLASFSLKDVKRHPEIKVEQGGDRQSKVSSKTNYLFLHSYQSL